VVRIFLFLILISSSAFAMPRQTLPWSAVTASDVAASKCKTMRAPTAAEIQNYLKSRRIGAGTDENVLGGALTLEYENHDFIQAFKKLVPSLPAKLIPLVQGCTSVSCAVGALWGKEYGNQLLYLMLRFGLNASEYSSLDDSSRFNANEMNTLLTVVHDLPNFALPFGENIPFHRFLRGSWLVINGKDKVIANASIHFFDPWEKQGSEERQYSAFHEMGHRFSSRGRGTLLEMQKKWTDLGGWILQNQAWKRTGNGCFISRYAQSEPDEDFAETVAAYRYAPARLLTACSSKYRYMKEVFQGTEYLTDGQCESAQIEF
jgi:hypothetical protein